MSQPTPLGVQNELTHLQKEITKIHPASLTWLSPHQRQELWNALITVSFYVELTQEKSNT